MIFEPAPIKDAWVVTLYPYSDERGYFARAFCREEFEAHGIDPAVAQVNTVFSIRKGTLRGLHYQTEPHAETKFVRCIRGAIYDMMVDMRPGSPTYLQHFGTELSAENRRMTFVPENVAHGYLTLAPDTEACYMVGAPYAADYELGIRYNDPALGIDWPIPVEVVSDKDTHWPRREGKEV